MIPASSAALPGSSEAPDQLLRRPISLELAPSEVAAFEPDPAVFPPGSRVFLSHIEGKSLADQAEAAGRLTRKGFRPVPHLGARNFDTGGDFAAHVDRLAAADVREALFVGGNPATARGPFAQAADLLSHAAMANWPVEKAYLAVHPERHPAVDAATLTAAFERKLILCRERGITPAAASQFEFDGSHLAGWARTFAQAHPGMELRLGLAGVTSLPKLVRYAVTCGIGPSLSVLRKSPGSLFNVAAERDPGDMLAALDAAALPAEINVHFFVFGGWKKTLDWVGRRDG
ncbi:methylenetetrahydrofolate reductase [Amorphus orientalis]|uniref:Methylenetetrahydrofolate reductase (NADPH) n=1 Tax=Amorphus orientalis TaxID=649198 RepID=A0AAE3VMJ6_9HYPH|nr:methylenetetrahydrofolate reductase [Amorphus orientalis]MDQ0314792.1 methylenetetrahydrofolate reductase (NADPH) [Amorphus orientalis]